MSYNKTTWANGDTITAEKLNNIENGIENAGGGALICTLVGEGGTGRVVDKTYGEIKTALDAGKVVILRIYGNSNTEYDYHTLASFEVYDEQENYPTTYTVTFANMPWTFYSGAANEYPTESLD